MLQIKESRLGLVVRGMVAIRLRKGGSKGLAVFMGSCPDEHETIVITDFGSELQG